LSCGYLGHHAGTRSLERLGDPMSHGFVRLESVAGSDQDDNSHGEPRQVLLVLKVLVGSEEDVEFLGRLGEQVPIL